MLRYCQDTELRHGDSDSEFAPEATAVHSHRTSVRWADLTLSTNLSSKERKASNPDFCVDDNVPLKLKLQAGTFHRTHVTEPPNLAIDLSVALELPLNTVMLSIRGALLLRQRLTDSRLGWKV